MQFMMLFSQGMEMAIVLVYSLTMQVSTILKKENHFV